MKLIIQLLFIATLLALSGCNTLKSTKVFAPESFGMEEIAEHVFVDSDMSSNLRSDLLVNYLLAEKNIQLIYGDMSSTPDVIACSTEKCFKKFGGVSSRAKSFAGQALLLSPRGLSSHIISHEISHNELYVRIGSFNRWRKIPQWFDEGLAVVVSNEPTHSQAAWNEIQKKGIPTPVLTELVSLRDWFKAIKKYGEHTATADNPSKYKVVYATAGNEVRRWYQWVGKKGVLDLFEMMNSGENFSVAYRKIAGQGYSFNYF